MALQGCCVDSLLKPTIEERGEMRETTELEVIDRLLEYETIEAESSKLKGETFSRVRKFKTLDQEYKIIWHCNICYLHSGNMQISFNTVKLSNTWPNRSKMNLQFYLNGNETPVCIVKIEDYPTDKK